MSFHSYMETFAEAWVAANTQTAVNLQLHPRTPEVRPLRASDVIEQELPTMLNKEQLSEQGHAPLALVRPSGMMTSDAYKLARGGGGGLSEGNMGASSLSPVYISHQQVQQAPSDRTVAIHTIIEASPSYKADESISIKKDTYVVLPSSTPFKEVVEAALLKLNYSHRDAMGAKGAIQVKGWEPLSFAMISRDPDSTIDSILGELTNVATLKIVLCGYNPESDDVDWNDQKVRCAVNELLTEMNQSKLAKVSPLSQSTISNIANSKYLARIGNEKCREFGAWYRQYRQLQAGELEDSVLAMANKDTRLTFHPIFELPKMREWYQACKNPSDQVLRRFLDEINDGHIRQQRPKVTLTKLKIWWKNEKQREKRIQLKQEKAEAAGSQSSSPPSDRLMCLNSPGYNSPQPDNHQPTAPRHQIHQHHNLTNLHRDPMMGQPHS